MTVAVADAVQDGRVKPRRRPARPWTCPCGYTGPNWTAAAHRELCAQAPPPGTRTVEKTPDQQGGRPERRRAVRATTLKARGEGRLPMLGQTSYPEGIARPRTRLECVDGPRPCPWVSCQHHLYLDVSEGGTIKLNFPDLEVHQLKETCSLDVADRGGSKHAAIGRVMNLTRQGVQDIETRALAKPGVRPALAPYVDDERRVKGRGVYERDTEGVPEPEEVEDEA